jgi:hypothetical protein
VKRWEREEDVLLALVDASPVDLAREFLARELGLSTSRDLRLVPDARLLEACAEHVRPEHVAEAQRSLAEQLGCDVASLGLVTDNALFSDTRR